MWFADESGPVVLDLPDSVAKFMRRLTSVAKPCETGGILIGRYSADLRAAMVARATRAPRDSKSRPTRFTRGTHGLDRMLSRAWRGGLHYLGEWHYHPGSFPEPSPTDRTQMSEIASEPKMQCATPLLLILGDVGQEPRIAAYAHIGGELRFLAPVLVREGSSSLKDSTTMRSSIRRR